MEFLVLNSSFESVDIIDSFESTIWTDRYSSSGDFEICMPVNSHITPFLQEECYLYSKESDHIMIVEQVNISSDVETGQRVLITGRSLESILERRIIWSDTVISGSLQNGIESLLNANVINPSSTDRKIDNFVFTASTEEAITSLNVEAQYLIGDNLYDAIHSLCSAMNIGFKITLSETNNFIFSLYSGADRSFSQDANPYVVFSPSYGNLSNSNFLKDSSSMKTVTLVRGEGYGSTLRTVVVECEDGAGSGLARREMFTDASSMYSNSSADYEAQLSQKGKEDLTGNNVTTAFEGKMEDGLIYTFGIDYFVGDIVQIKNEYGIEATSRVIEVVRSQNAGEIGIYPTFSAVE